jgi:MFS family permease
MHNPSPPPAAQSPSPLAIPDLRRFLMVRAAFNAAELMLTVAIGWQVYDATRDPTDLGLVGLVLFLPQVLLSLVAGQVADRVERRIVIGVCLTVEMGCAAALLLLTRHGIASLAPIFAVLVVLATARTFLGPANQSLLPLLVPKEVFPRAVAWSSSARQVAVVSGPALGGLLYGFGAELVYGAVALLLFCAILLTAAMRTRLRPVDQGKVGLDSVLAGIRFIRSRPAILGAISLDLFAVLFGGATALLPVYARDILQIGPWGLGLLRSAPAVGAALCALWLAHYPLRRNAGIVMFGCVGGFGLATIVFGLSASFPLSLASLVVMGACDMVSVFVRQSLVQLGTPDAMRGRVSAVNLIFIGASNELGEFESGITAGWFGTVPAVVLGGLGTLLVVVLWAARFKELRQVDRLEDVQA